MPKAVGGARLGCLGDLRGTQDNNALGLCAGLSALVSPTFLASGSLGGCLEVIWAPALRRLGEALPPALGTVRSGLPLIC